MKRAVIYKITSPTGRIYIGKTVDFVNRMTSYRNLNNHQQPLIHSSIAKYGWENHQVEVLEESTPEELINLEITYIKQYNSYHYENPLGMNLTRGGDGTTGRVDSLEVRTRRAQQHIGSKRSEASKKLMRDLKKGKIPPASLLPRSEKQLHHLKYGNIGRATSSSTVAMRQYTRLVKFLDQYGGVLQYDLNGNFIQEWLMLPKHIAKAMNIDDSYFNKILKGGSSKCANYLWTYKNKTI